MDQLPYACEFTEFSFMSFLMNEPMKIENGSLRVPSGPGLGVEPDMNLISKYAA
jgi:L-alanine-DL-glutamate epimerase-like enolase superfamily enzyme